MIPDSRTETSAGWQVDDQTTLHRRLVRVFGPEGLAPEVIDLTTERLLFGREASVGYVLHDTTASRRHAEIRLDKNDRHELVDLESKNGSWVDGRRIQSMVLQPGAVLRLGDHLFVFEELRTPSGIALAPGPEVALSRAWAEHQVERAASSDHALLIQGPTGAGKERLAQLYHEASGRQGRLVPVNCAGFSRELLGSELFGHVKGAFSGADADRPGLVVSADGGTLFLDEVADLPVDQQPALLRTLQERSVRAVGADQEMAVDLRIISATHKDLEEMAETGDFRADLFARLAGLVVKLPGLARRRVEILPLLRRFARKLRPTPAAAECLLLHRWPRNIRELQGLAGRLTALLPGPNLDLTALPESIREAGPSSESEHEPPSLDAEALRALLQRCEGNVARLARTIGKSRQATYRLLQEFELDAAAFRPQDD